MNLLALDTATRATAVALCSSEDRPLERRDDPPPGARPRHASRLMPLAAELLEEAGIGWAEVDEIAVGIGPGTFTGLRIGVATARALALARGVPLSGISTLESLALNGCAVSSEQGLEAVIAVLDARRGEVFAAGWRVEHREPLFAASTLARDALVERIKRLGLRSLAIGEGAIEFRVLLQRSGAFIPEDDSTLHRVTAINHCRLARHQHAGDPEQVRPQYLRLPDAEIARRATGSK